MASERSETSLTKGKLRGVEQLVTTSQTKICPTLLKRSRRKKRKDEGLHRRDSIASSHGSICRLRSSNRFWSNASMSNLETNPTADGVRVHCGKGLVAARLNAHDPAHSLVLEHNMTLQRKSLCIEQVAPFADESSLEDSLKCPISSSDISQFTVKQTKNQKHDLQLLEAVEVVPLRNKACCHPSEFSWRRAKNVANDSEGSRFLLSLKPQLTFRDSACQKKRFSHKNGSRREQATPSHKNWIERGIGFKSPACMFLWLKSINPHRENSHNSVLDSFFASQTVEYQTGSVDAMGFTDTNVDTDVVEISISSPTYEGTAKQISVISAGQSVLTAKTEPTETLASGVGTLPSIPLSVLPNLSDDSEGSTSPGLETDFAGPPCNYSPTSLTRGNSERDCSTSRPVCSSSKEVTFEGLILDADPENLLEMQTCQVPVSNSRSLTLETHCTSVPRRHVKEAPTEGSMVKRSQPPCNSTITQKSTQYELDDDRAVEQEQSSGIMRVASDRSLEVSVRGEVFDTEDESIFRILAELQSVDCQANSPRDDTEQPLGIHHPSSGDSGIRRSSTLNSLSRKALATHSGNGILNGNSNPSLIRTEGISQVSADRDQETQEISCDHWQEQIDSAAPFEHPKILTQDAVIHAGGISTISATKHQTTYVGDVPLKTNGKENSTKLILERSGQSLLKPFELDGSVATLDLKIGNDHSGTTIEDEDVDWEALPLLPSHSQEKHYVTTHLQLLRGLPKRLHEAADSESTDSYDYSLSNPSEHLSNASTSSSTSVEEKKDADDPEVEAGLALGFHTEKVFRATSHKSRTRNKKTQPLFYDEEFTWGFLHEMMTSGMALLHLKPPESIDSKDWVEVTVNMVMEPGTNGDDSPKIQWSIFEVGHITHVTTTNVSLFRIRSVRFGKGAESEMNEIRNSSPFFSIVTDDGTGHIFQAGTPDDRDVLVNGLRNVIAWFCYHLVIGDGAASLMLYDEDSRDADSMSTAALGMSRITHELLDFS